MSSLCPRISGGETFLRMALAAPKLGTVWPGSPSETEPRGEQRKLLDAVLPAAHVAMAVSSRSFAEEQGYSMRDMRLLRQAWALWPGRGAMPEAPGEYTRRPDAP